MLGPLVPYLCLLAAFLLWRGCRKPARFPPGPRRWPVLGSRYLKTRVTAGEKVKLLREYGGKIVGMWLGNLPVVLVADYYKLNSLCKRGESTGKMWTPLSVSRPGYWLMRKKKKLNALGIIFTKGKQWYEQRKVLMTSLREFGFGKRSMETGIQAEVAKLQV